MGYHANIELLDQRRRRWVGVHTPTSANLLELFTPLLAEDGLEEGLEGLQARLPELARVEARLGPNALGLVLDGVGRVPDVVLKLVPPSARGPLDAMLHVHDGSRARRAHLMAHRLRAFGIGTARPLGYLERASRPRSAPSLLVSAWVRRPDLRAWWRSPEHTTAARRARLAQLGGLLRALHAQGFFHADLHAENMLVEDDEVLLLDLESIRTVGRRDRVITKSLARLARDASELGVSRADRLRVLDVYLRHQADRRTRRRWLWRRIEATNAARLVSRAPPASEEPRADL